MGVKGPPTEFATARGQSSASADEVKVAMTRFAPNRALGYSNQDIRWKFRSSTA